MLTDNTNVFITIVVVHVIIAYIIGKKHLRMIHYLNHRDRKLVNDALRYRESNKKA